MNKYKRYYIVEIEVTGCDSSKDADELTRRQMKMMCGSRIGTTRGCVYIKRKCLITHEDLHRMGSHLHITKRLTAWFKPIFTALRKKYEQQRLNGTRW